MLFSRLFHWLPTLLSGLQAQHPHSLHTQTKISLLCWFIPITAAIVNPTSISAKALTDLASCDPPTESLQWWMEPTCDARSPAYITLYLPRRMNRLLNQHIWTVGIHLSVSLWQKQRSFPVDIILFVHNVTWNWSWIMIFFLVLLEELFNCEFFNLKFILTHHISRCILFSEL